MSINESFIGMLPPHVWLAINMVSCLIIGASLLWMLVSYMDPDDPRYGTKTIIIAMRAVSVVLVLCATINLHDDFMSFQRNAFNRTAVSEIGLNAAFAALLAAVVYFHEFIIGRHTSEH